MTADNLPRCTVCNEQKAPRGAWIGIEVWAMCHEQRGCPGYAQEPDARDHWPDDKLITSDKKLVTSVRVETHGGHDHVHVWNRGGKAGVLIVTEGDGAQLEQRLEGQRQWLEAEIAKVEANDLFKQPAALIQINAPVALMQVELKARKQALEQMLEQCK
jgi:hypothetical protein